ncbi:MAG TPA: right-handed parallel beta-helix repeat-containing protein [Polyangiaceae bacterium]|nr:right-handed parallel beta-helix repeat-containing protein [Polyangiaceae bacterium]
MHQPKGSYFLVFAALAIALGATATAHATSGRMIITSNKTLTANHTGQIQFNANNITLDCAGHTISFTSANTTGCGSAGTLRCGIRAQNRSGITIKNCEVSGAFNYGVWLAGTTSSTVTNVTARSNVLGFRIENSSSLNIRSSSALTCTAGGFEIRDSSNLTMIADNAVSNAGDGIDVNNSSFVNIQQAQVLDNGVNGIEFDGGPNATVGSSTIRYNGQHGLSLDPGTNVATHPCSPFSISSNFVEFNNEDGIRLQNCDNGFIRNNTAQGNGICNANQNASSTGNTWTGNLLQNWCGTVPNPH